MPNLFRKDELVMVDVKIKAEICRLELMPAKLIETLESTCKPNGNPADD